MIKNLQTRIVNYRDLCSKELVNDLKNAVTCEVVNVCRLSCHRCPHILEKINIGNIKLKGLKSYSLTLEKNEDEQLLFSITSLGIHNWLIEKKLPL